MEGISKFFLSYFKTINIYVPLMEKVWFLLDILIFTLALFSVTRKEAL